jgi:hypothetical protein
MFVEIFSAVLIIVFLALFINAIMESVKEIKRNKRSERKLIIKESDIKRRFKFYWADDSYKDWHLPSHAEVKNIYEDDVVLYIRGTGWKHVKKSDVIKYGTKTPS